MVVAAQVSDPTMAYAITVVVLDRWVYPQHWQTMTMSHPSTVVNGLVCPHAWHDHDPQQRIMRRLRLVVVLDVNPTTVW